MTDNTQPEALRLAGLLELAPEDGVEPQTTEDAAAELRRLHTENTALQQGYAAARLEIESLKSKIAESEVEHADAPENLHCKSTQKRLATQWGFVPAGAQQPGTTAWVPLPGTLPEPVKPVLLDIGKKHPIRAMWVAKHTVETASDDLEFGEYDEATDTYYCPEGWYEQNEHEDVHWRVDKTPVAWCELPSKEQK